MKTDSMHYYLLLPFVVLLGFTSVSYTHLDVYKRQDVLIADNDFHPIKPEGRRYNSNVDDIAAKPVVIGDNVFIGTRSMILKGVNIGENSVIGAGSVVVSDIPAGVVAAGN